MIAGLNTVIKIWLREIRANFLVLSVVLVMIGGAAAWHEGYFSAFLFFVTLFGVVAAHISVNLFNEYSDWRIGIDAKTVRTPFSGGSGNLQEGLLEPVQVRRVAWVMLAIAFLTGLGLARVSRWQVLIIVAAGGVAVVFYTDYLTKWMIGELVCGITIGSLVVIGAFFVQTRTITYCIIYASIPPGLLTMGLLLLNEFPDVEADHAGGRRHIVIILGKKRAAIVYASLLFVVYSALILGVITGMMPIGVLFGLLTLPFAVTAAYRVIRYPRRCYKDCICPWHECYCGTGHGFSYGSGVYHWLRI